LRFSAGFSSGRKDFSAIGAACRAEAAGLVAKQIVFGQLSGPPDIEEKMMGIMLRHISRVVLSLQNFTRKWDNLRSVFWLSRDSNYLKHPQAMQNSNRSIRIQCP
jgi:hypothetical protein